MAYEVRARRILRDHHEEVLALRRSTLLESRSFDATMLARLGQGFKRPYSVLDIGFILSGHQRRHRVIIRERYMLL